MRGSGRGAEGRGALGGWWRRGKSRGWRRLRMLWALGVSGDGGRGGVLGRRGKESWVWNRKGRGEGSCGYGGGRKGGGCGYRGWREGEERGKGGEPWV